MVITIETIGTFVKDYGTTIGVILGPIVYFVKKWLDTRHNRTILATAILAEIESMERRYNYSTGGGFNPHLLF